MLFGQLTQNRVFFRSLFSPPRDAFPGSMNFCSIRQGLPTPCGHAKNTTAPSAHSAPRRSRVSREHRQGFVLTWAFSLPILRGGLSTD